MLHSFFSLQSQGFNLFLLGVASLLVGSVLNMMIHRLPLMLHATWHQECAAFFKHAIPATRPSINLFRPRSFCPSCNKTIPIWHNIPLLSFILLRGRCASCKNPISWRYPLVEAVCALLSVGAGIHFGFTPTLAFALLFIWIIICLGFIDYTHQLLPDSLTLSLLWVGLIANTHGLFTPLATAVLSAAGAYVSLWLLMQCFYLMTGKIGMGHGDFKLFAAFGAWFGVSMLPLILLISSFMGAIAGFIYLRRTGQSKNTPIPFGPFLCIAGLISLFYGQQMIQWYLLYCHLLVV